MDRSEEEYQRGYEDSAALVEEIMAEIRARCMGETEDYCIGLKEGIAENLTY